MEFQFRIKKHNAKNSISSWGDIPVDREFFFKSVYDASRYALLVIGNNEDRSIQEIRFNSKGSLQGHYIAGYSRLTWNYCQSGKLQVLPNDKNDNDYLAAIYSNPH